MTAAVDTSVSTGLGLAEFDFVVIGGGTSGLTVASRLTENKDIRVLVLEAGKNRLDDPKITIPGLAASTYSDPDYDWCITSEPQVHLNGRSIGQPTAKVLGGSSAINLGMIIYPSQSDFDSWEKLGNAGWGWKSIAPYFRKFHTFTEPDAKELREGLMLDYMVEGAQGDSGPVQVSFGGTDGSAPFSRAWPRAFNALNLEMTGDPVSGNASGAFNPPANIHPATRARSHAGSAYLTDDVLRRPNLRVLTEALVEKIVVERQPDGSCRATGVRFTAKDGSSHQISAKHEVALAAGALKTPQLLELSGIGSKELLASHGIECFVDNKQVGENLQDHPTVPASWEVRDPTTSGDQMRDPAVQQAAFAAYLSTATGPLCVGSTPSSFLPLLDQHVSQVDLSDLFSAHLGDSDSDSDLPASLRAQYDVLKAQLSSPGSSSAQYTLAPFQIAPAAGPSPKDFLSMPTPGCYASIISVLNHPFSRGRVHIRSADPRATPRFDPRAMSHPLDLEMLARHLFFAERLRATPPLAGLFKEDGRRIHNGGRAVETVDEAREMVRDGYIPHFHLCGSAAMMPQELGGVVDSRLNVYGVGGLRVVDASVFPLIPRGNIQSDVYAVAERAADILAEDWESMRR
ncbi:glucose-methanol-choline oxidoreductase [Diplodia corticola]|uniref:Glucose-methanol-choline oxidoreductase n=1 Tax=Diplodia corticola TaxID=236234 RepID=A0A1J9SDT4_9PEZI|nr:glucose-methanol-choline oxidoreductase [Diplodia corticola]OJD37749.1 glucose-methanol-choline oxidoreductase [Diplodia corticola]